MRKLIPYIAFACLTSFTATSGLAVIAGGCNSHINKTVDINCTEDDIECQTKKAVNSRVDKTVSS